MTGALKKPLEDHPGLRQALAANPGKSHWVGASAGTGKTKVLIDRVLRLMLPRPGMDAASATPPGRILCLTFTKTGAAEMSNRIYAALSEWSVMEEEKLAGILRDLTGEKPSATVMEEARRLFARVLDTPGGLKIMTIHSFCQSVLKRFPVEAGLAPHFELMDERGAVEYLTRCLHDIVAEAKARPGSALAESFSLLALYLDGEGMSDLMARFMADRSLLAEILRFHGDGEGRAEKTADALYARLRLDRDETEEALLSGAGRIDAAREKDLVAACRALLSGGVRDKGRGEKMQAWLEAPARRGELLPLYRGAFFTQAGKPFESFASNKAVAAFAGIEGVMAEEAERLALLESKLKSLRFAKINAALLTVASEMIGHYERHKRETDRLDFDDLIIRTSALLAEPGAVAWVLYKLDEGIDHILVDEAQDTSPHQWRVVQALSSEFFAGKGTRDDVTRTLFVVGDEKQSIFSFQGADPAAFARMQEFFGGKALEVQDGWEILLEHSFRSTRTVLEVVDAVFARDGARKGVVAAATREIRHLPFREGQAGLVEIWPLAESAPSPAPSPWAPPVGIEEGSDAASLLASKIAATIRGWLDKGEVLPSKNRPVRAGDVLVLVQSRGSFVELLMRALKEKKVPVAGIDRMRLSEEIAVMDLLAAAEFALQPRDELMLATVLKSPLVGVSEEELFALCHGRREKLWPALQKERPQAAAILSQWIARAANATPYEFFAEILSTPCPGDDLSGRRAFYGRLGFDIHDALDEFLNVCLHYEQTHTPSLQRFLSWFMKGKTDVKREQEQHLQDQVRIMTVHGAKGLQAPIVFMPDTVKKLHDHNKGRVRLIWPDDERGVPMWSPRAEFDAPVYEILRDAARERQEEEYRRLLYVALTRAEDRLYVCGWRGVREPKDDCWYSLVKAAFPAEAAKESFSFGNGECGEPLARRTHPQTAPPEKDRGAKGKSGAARRPLPGFALQRPPEEVYPPAPLAPSRPGEDEPAVKGPLEADDGYRFRRGIIVHQILEVLPQLPPGEWGAALTQYLARPGLGIPAQEQPAFAMEIMKVLQHPEFAPIFGPGSRAEVPVVGFAGARHILSGQMDRLLVTGREVLVVDYKTNRPPPKDVAGVAAIYLKQMAAYRAVLREVYPGIPVRCALLWTDGPFLMPLPDTALDSHAP